MPPIKKRRVEEMESTKNTAQEQSTKTKGKTQSSEDKVYMESKVGTSDKFYELIRKEKVVTTRYGRNGTSGKRSYTCMSWLIDSTLSMILDKV